MAQLLAIVSERLGQGRAQARPRPPPERAPDEPVVRVVVADVDFLPVAWKFFHDEFSATVEFDEQLCELAQRYARRAAEIENFSDRRAAARREEKRLDRVVHIGEVA